MVENLGPLPAEIPVEEIGPLLPADLAAVRGVNRVAVPPAARAIPRAVADDVDREGGRRRRRRGAMEIALNEGNILQRRLRPRH